MDKLITIWPFVHINKVEDDILIYNTITGKSITYNNNDIIAKFAKELIKRNYSIIVDSNDFEIYNKLGLLHDIVKNHMGYIMDNANKINPISPQSINLNKSETIVKDFKKDHYLFDNLKEITIYINNYSSFNNYLNQNTILFGNTQFVFPVIEKDEKFLDIEQIKHFIKQTEKLLESNIKVNIVGGNILQHPGIEELITLLGNSNKVIDTYFFHYSDFLNTKQILQKFSKSSKKTLFIDFPYDRKILNNALNLGIKAGCNIEFIVESDQNLKDVDEVIKEFNISKYNIKPFFNGKNMFFFKDHVFITTEDIYSVKESMPNLLKKSISNPHFFGKLIVDYNENVYISKNDTLKCSFDILNIEQLLSYQIHNENSLWRKSRVKTSPCNKCIYNFLCPPISEYELYIKLNNLCHIK